jgi:hypothetical protein
MRKMALAPRRSLQVRILASVLLGLSVVLLGLAGLVLKITDEGTRHALAARLALAQAIQRASDREIRDALRLAERLGAVLETQPEQDLVQLLDLTGVLDTVAVVAPDGRILHAAALHGVPPAWPALALRASQGTQIFPVPGDRPGVGVSVAVGPDRLLLARIDPRRLLGQLASHPTEERYAAQFVGLDGSQIAVEPLGEDAVRHHASLVQPLQRRAEAGIVLHMLPDHEFDHYIAYAPLATLPGWGVTVEQPRDVVVALPQRLRMLILTVGLLMLLVGGAVAWVDVRRVVMPLRTLASSP